MMPPFDTVCATGVDHSIIEFWHVLNFPAENLRVEARYLSRVFRLQFPVNNRFTHRDLLCQRFKLVANDLFSSALLDLMLVRFFALNRFRASTASPPAEVPPAAISAWMSCMLDTSNFTSNYAYP